MDILIKRKMSKRMLAVIYFIISIVIILALFWICVLVTDYTRFKQNEIPVFTTSCVIEDKTNGYTTTYNGIRI